jgi:Vps53-like, N-terminal
MAPSTLPLSPMSPLNQSSSRSLATSIAPLDPLALLDTLDQNRTTKSGEGTTSTTTPNTPFDPIDFLNQHFETERSLSRELPLLRDAVGTRMQLLNDRISDALQKQNDTADSTRRHVQDAQASVIELQRRILQVKEKASQSEKAVLEITADMKRLDCAKQHNGPLPHSSNFTC